MRYNSLTRRAAALVGLPVDVFVTRAVNEQAARVIATAQEALALSGLRDEREIEWRAIEKRQRDDEKQAHQRAKARGELSQIMLEVGLP